MIRALRLCAVCNVTLDFSRKIFPEYAQVSKPKETEGNRGESLVTLMSCSAWEEAPRRPRSRAGVRSRRRGRTALITVVPQEDTLSVREWGTEGRLGGWEAERGVGVGARDRREGPGARGGKRGERGTRSTGSRRLNKSVVEDSRDL